MNKKIAFGITGVVLALFAVMAAGMFVLTMSFADLALNTPEIAQCVESELGIDLHNGSILASLEDPAVLAELEAIDADPAKQAVVEACVESVLG